MDADQPGLFDLPDSGSPAPPVRLPRGRNRETWVRTASAEVRIVDIDALREAAARAAERAVTIRLPADPDAEDATDADTDPDSDPDPDPDPDSDLDPDPDPGPASAEEPIDMLVWLVWPTDGLEVLVEAGAFRILWMESEVVADSDVRGTLTWTVTVQLTDVPELRRLAALAHPAEADSIADSLAVAWNCAADPFVPLRSVPGVAWRPGEVEVHHVPRRSRPGRTATT